MSVVPGPSSSLRHEAVSFAGVVERNWYLIKRYGWWELAFFFWSLANTLTIVFIAKGIKAAGGQIDVNRATTTLLIGAVIWSYLGLVFEFMIETVAWERWEGTIEYTFMAPIRRAVHLAGVGIFAVALRRAAQRGPLRCHRADVRPAHARTRTSSRRRSCLRSRRSRSWASGR